MKPLEIALIDAAQQGDLQSLIVIINVLTAKNNLNLGDINCTNGVVRKTALHYTIEGNTEKHYQCFESLWAIKRIRADIFDENGRTALHAAIELENTAFNYFDQLVQYPNRLDINQHQGQTPSSLTHACQKKHLSQVKKLVALGADLYSTLADTNFVSLFIWLIEENDAEVVELFLRQGMNASDINFHRKNPLLAAISKKHTATIKVLLRFGYGISDDLTENFLKLENFQDDFYWLVGSRAANRSLEGNFFLAFISQEDLVNVREKLTTIREQIGSRLPLTEEQKSILLSRIEVEWRQWDESSEIAREIERLYDALKAQQSIHGEFQSSKFDYLFDIPHKKLLKHLKSDVHYDHTALLKWIALNQRGSLITRISEFITQDPDLADIRRQLLFSAYFSKAIATMSVREENRNIGKEEESDEENNIGKKELNTENLSEKLNTLTANNNFTVWRNELETKKNIAVSDKELDDLIKNLPTLQNYSIVGEIYCQTAELGTVGDKTLSLHNTLLTLNNWMQQVVSLSGAYENRYYEPARTFFYSAVILDAIALLVFVVSSLITDGFLENPTVGVITFFLLFVFLFIWGVLSNDNQVRPALNIFNRNNIANHTANAAFRFLIPVTLFYRNNFTSLQGLQKILLTIQTYLHPEQHHSLSNSITYLTHPSCYPTVRQTIRRLRELSSELQTLADAISSQINDMDTKNPQAITLPARFALIRFHPDVMNLGELAPKHTKSEVAIEIETMEAPATEHTPFIRN